MTFSYKSERPSEDTLNLRLKGEVAEENISQLQEEIAALQAQREGALNVLLDFTEVEQCDVKTRYSLLELQRARRTTKGRTAYVADRPRIRGIALWVIHRAEDGRAKVLGRASQAQRWFDRDDDRLVEASSNGSKLAQRLASVRRLVR